MKYKFLKIIALAVLVISPFLFRNFLVNAATLPTVDINPAYPDLNWGLTPASAPNLWNVPNPIRGTATDDSGVAQVQVVFRESPATNGDCQTGTREWDGSNWISATSGANCATPAVRLDATATPTNGINITWSRALPTSFVSGKTYGIYFRSKDTAGNYCSGCGDGAAWPAVYFKYVETTLPTIDINNPTNLPGSWGTTRNSSPYVGISGVISGTAADNVGISKVQILIQQDQGLASCKEWDGDSWVSGCSATKILNAVIASPSAINTAWSYSSFPKTSDLTTGKSYRVNYRAQDVNGNWSHPSSWPYVGFPYDVAASVPTITISASPSSGAAGTINPIITFSATNSPTTCSATGNWKSTPPIAASNNQTQDQGVLTQPGTYTYTLVCTNASGSSAPASATVTVNPAPVMSGTLTPASQVCTIALGASTCTNVTLSWSIANTEAVVSKITANGVADITLSTPTIGGSYSGTKSSISVPYNNGADTTFYLYNNAVPLKTATVSPSCISGSAWDSTDMKCLAYNGGITRADAALELKNRLQLPHTVCTPSDPAYHAFTDISGNTQTQQTAIEDLWQAGITAGCSSDGYCPNMNIPRNQAAVFLGEVTNFWNSSSLNFWDQIFTDLPTSTSLDQSFYYMINGASRKMSTAGVQIGTSATLFDPYAEISRATYTNWMDVAHAKNIAPIVWNSTTPVNSNKLLTFEEVDTQPLRVWGHTPSQSLTLPSSDLVGSVDVKINCFDWIQATLLGGNTWSLPQNFDGLLKDPGQTNTIFVRLTSKDKMGYGFSGRSTLSTIWKEFVTAPVVLAMSGTLSSSTPSCTIALGAGSCTTNLSWSVVNPSSIPTAITANGMNNINVTNTLATPQSGTQSVTVPYNSRTFFLYNGAYLLAQTTVTSSCASGTDWDPVTSTCKTILVGAPDLKAGTINQSAATLNIPINFSAIISNVGNVPTN